MKYKAVLFDLDGTLLPMDQDAFTKGYFGLLAKTMTKYGYHSEQLLSGIIAGTKAMVKNDGSMTNEKRFWSTFTSVMNQDVMKDIEHFNDFYQNEFQSLVQYCCPTPMAKEVIDYLKQNHVRLLLATNPLFPPIATHSRIHWAGLEVNDFEIVTTYDMIGTCKPNVEYYKEILNRVELKPEDCLMVGNDMNEDMVVSQIGIDTYLLTDCLINRDGKDITQFKNGDFKSLLEYLKTC